MGGRLWQFVPSGAGHRAWIDRQTWDFKAAVVVQLVELGGIETQKSVQDVRLDR